MAPQAQRTRYTGPALIRLLSRLIDADVAPAPEGAGQRLSQWLQWTDAIALAAALDGGAPPVAPLAAPARRPAAADDAELERVRAALATPIAHPAPRAEAPDVDAAGYRRRYAARQQAMEAGIAPLRARLRARLAAGPPALARLAALDAVMEQALAPQERRLLWSVPALLEQRFEQLRRTAADGPDDTPPAAWLASFGKDMDGVLHAELDFRLQPVEGLLAALRTP